jgi:hypothetical protein
MLQSPTILFIGIADMCAVARAASDLP